MPRACKEKVEVTGLNTHQRIILVRRFLQRLIARSTKAQRISRTIVPFVLLCGGVLIQRVQLFATYLLDAQGVGFALFAVVAVVGDEPVAGLALDQVTQLVQEN